MKNPLFLVYFWKRLEGKMWLGIGMGGCDRWTVVGRDVNSGG